MIAYPSDRLHQEIAFLAYYLHWDLERILELEHQDRQRWCAEVSAINQRLNEPPKHERSIEAVI